jgi:hypothetical protein
VTREPEWDDVTRDRVLSLAAYKRGLCPCGCGVPIKEASDPKQGFVVDTFTCYATRAKERLRQKRKHDAEEAAKKSGDKSLAETYDLGVVYYIRDTPSMREDHGG